MYSAIKHHTATAATQLLSTPATATATADADLLTPSTVPTLSAVQPDTRRDTDGSCSHCRPHTHTSYSTHILKGYRITPAATAAAAATTAVRQCHVSSQL